MKIFLSCKIETKGSQFYPTRFPTGFRSRIYSILFLNTMKRIFSLVSGLFLTTTTFSQIVVRNFSFEHFDPLYRSVGWAPQNTKGQYIIALDTVAAARSGKHAVIITPKPRAESVRGTALWNTVLAPNLLKGKKKLAISAYIKTEGVSEGVASIWMQLNGNGRIVADKNSDDPGGKGTTDWTRYTIELPLTDEVVSVSFGCKMNGTGKAWYDDFEVLIDDVPLK